MAPCDRFLAAAPQEIAKPDGRLIRCGHMVKIVSCLTIVIALAASRLTRSGIAMPHRRLSRRLLCPARIS